MICRKIIWKKVVWVMEASNMLQFPFSGFPYYGPNPYMTYLNSKTTSNNL